MTPLHARIQRSLIAGLLASLLLPVTTGCSSFGLSGEEQPAAVDAADGAAPAAALGRGERTLLQDYQALIQERDRLDQELQSTRGELETQRAATASHREDREREHAARIAAEADAKRLENRARELESKLLADAIATARMEQELLRLRIQVLESELGQLEDPLREPPSEISGSGGRRHRPDTGSAEARPAAPPGGGPIR